MPTSQLGGVWHDSSRRARSYRRGTSQRTGATGEEQQGQLSAAVGTGPATSTHGDTKRATGFRPSHACEVSCTGASSLIAMRVLL
jgi:hypothetical protein